MRLICAFTCDGLAVAKQRPKFAGRGKFVRAYTPKQTVEFERSIHNLATIEMAKTGGVIPEDPIILKIAITRAPLKSWSKKKTAHMMGRLAVGTRDLDNQVKAVSDGLNKAAFMDDRQVAALQVERRWGDVERFRVAVYVEEAGDGPA